MLQDLTDIGETAPGIEIASNQGNVEVWIRGIGSSNNTELGDPAAATHLDGVYIPRPSGISSVFFDIDRVEANLGPQGIGVAEAADNFGLGAQYLRKPTDKLRPPGRRSLCAYSSLYHSESSQD